MFHAPRSAGTALGTDTASSSDAAIALRRCRVSAQNPHEATAPIASGRRSPKCSLALPITTAPSAGPARKIIP